MTVQSSGVSGIRPMQYRLLKDGRIQSRVVGKGSLFTWSHWGRLSTDVTPQQWLADKLEDGYSLLAS